MDRENKRCRRLQLELDELADMGKLLDPDAGGDAGGSGGGGGSGGVRGEGEAKSASDAMASAVAAQAARPRNTANGQRETAKSPTKAQAGRTPDGNAQRRSARPACAVPGAGVARPACAVPGAGVARPRRAAAGARAGFSNFHWIRRRD